MSEDMISETFDPYDPADGPRYKAWVDAYGQEMMKKYGDRVIGVRGDFQDIYAPEHLRLYILTPVFRDG